MIRTISDLEALLSNPENGLNQLKGYLQSLYEGPYTAFWRLDEHRTHKRFTVFIGLKDSQTRRNWRKDADELKPTLREGLKWLLEEEPKEEAEKSICSEADAAYSPCLLPAKVRISKEVRQGGFPLQGKREESDWRQTGWVLWVGDQKATDTEIVDCSKEEIRQIRPDVEPYLALPVGWGFTLEKNGEGRVFRLG